MPENFGNHDLIIESRHKATMTGIKDVANYDEEVISALSECGEITLKGRGLKISKLSVESGDMTVEGEINSVLYTEPRTVSNFLGRVFK